MMMFAYFLVAFGCHEAGWGLWRSITWPIDMGIILVNASMKAGKE